MKTTVIKNSPRRTRIAPLAVVSATIAFLASCSIIDELDSLMNGDEYTVLYDYGDSPNYTQSDESQSTISSVASAEEPKKGPKFTNKCTFKDGRIVLLQGNIADITADAIVNPCTAFRSSFGDVGDAIHKAAGPELAKECRVLLTIDFGEAKITHAYNLSAKYVIHTALYRWTEKATYADKTSAASYKKMKKENLQLLRNSYNNSLALAEEYGCKTVAFPSLGTDFDYPLNKDAETAAKAISEYLDKGAEIETVYMICADEKTLQTYKTYFTSAE